MAIDKFTVSRMDSVSECFPHLCRTRSGRILLACRDDAPLAQIRGYRYGLTHEMMDGSVH